MSREHALRQLMLTVQQDLAGYQQLQGLLEQQFAVALGGDAQRLGACAEAVLALGAVLQARQQQRLQLACQLSAAGEAVSVSALLERLPETLRSRCLGAWQALAARVDACRELNRRNGEFFMQQQERLGCVLHGESDVYLAQ